jgi:hypothetical protein
MQVVGLTAQEARKQLAAEFGLPATDDGVSHELLAGVVRSQLARMFPCAPSALLTAVRRAMASLDQDRDALMRRAEDVLEDLQTSGDIVELAQITVHREQAVNHWLFPAPPSFVLRGARAYIFGIAPDDAAFLPAEHWRSLQNFGAARFLDLDAPSALTPQSLIALGLRQLDDQEWLGPDRQETAEQHLTLLRDRLASHGMNGHLPGLQVLQHQTAARASYRRRWISDSTTSGLHVIRVEQPHGAPLWYVAELNSGRCTRSLLLPFHLDQERACDQAWRAQLALDAEQGHPATYTVRLIEGKAILSVDFPIPLTARRRLLFLGGPEARGNHPYEFTIPASEVSIERRYLEERLWLTETTN